MLDPTILIGKTADEAVRIIMDNKMLVRIMAIDGKVFHAGSGCCRKFTANNKRVSLKIINTIVVDAYVG